MRTFQFDECFSDASVIDACNLENRVNAQPFPPHLKGTKDPALLPILLPQGNPIITTDRRLHRDHKAYIPLQHPGIVVVCYSYRIINRHFSARAAAKILKEFKSAVADWFRLPINNSVIELTERTIEVFHVEKNELIRDWGARYKRCVDDGEESDWVNFEIAEGPDLVIKLVHQLAKNTNQPLAANELPEKRQEVTD